MQRYRWGFFTPVFDLLKCAASIYEVVGQSSHVEGGDVKLICLVDRGGCFGSTYVGSVSGAWIRSLGS